MPGSDDAVDPHLRSTDEQVDEVPASCCSTPDDELIASRFDRRSGRWTDAQSFPAMVGVSTGLLALLNDAAELRPSVLELGCGSGALATALLMAGASRVSGIDLSPVSVGLARRRVAAAGVADRARFSVGNAVTEDLERHDWVILDRSICCFPDRSRLLQAAIAAAGSRIALSVPESRGWRGAVNRVVWTAENVWDRLSGGCPGYVHDLNDIEEQLGSAGFRPVPGRIGHVGLWYTGVHER
jgi:magnesium-protoporphyrin O-methyltransferase